MAICHNKQYERAFVRLMTMKDILCMRVAGSGQAVSAVCDCIVFLPQPCLVEIKATKDQVFVLKAEVRRQLDKMEEACNKFHLIPILAIKFKQRGWNLVKLPVGNRVEFNEKKKLDEDSMPFVEFANTVAIT